MNLHKVIKCIVRKNMMFCGSAHTLSEFRYQKSPLGLRMVVTTCDATGISDVRVIKGDGRKPNFVMQFHRPNVVASELGALVADCLQRSWSTK